MALSQSWKDIDRSISKFWFDIGETKETIDDVRWGNEVTFGDTTDIAGGSHVSRGLNQDWSDISR